MTMPSGYYYVGDLYYVMNDDQWIEICDLLMDSSNGEFTLKDGTDIAIYGTAYGDGLYKDEKGREYSVDSGTIGCVLVSSLEEKFKAENIERLGNFITFNSSFETFYDNGDIFFGAVCIETEEPDE